MGKSGFPPGYRFCPTDVELVVYYLKRKVMGKKLHFNVISEVDIYKYEPYDLPDKSCLGHGDLKWYFFCPRGRKYGTGERVNRTTERGFWKTTGRDRPVQYRDKVVGMIKTLVYHTGKAPHGDRTDWVMHEYRLQDKDLVAFVLCIIFHKDGPGPKNGAQYGAPFIEDEWTDDEEDTFVKPFPSANLSSPNFVKPGNLVASTSYAPESLCGVSSSEVHSFESALSAHMALPPVTENDDMLATETDDVVSMLDLSEDDNMFSNEETSEKLGEPNCEANTEAGTCADEIDIYSDLGEIGLNDFYNSQNGYTACYAFDEMIPSDNFSFLELKDLEKPLFLDEDVLTGPRRADDINLDLGYYEQNEQSSNSVDTPNGNLHVPGLDD